MPCFIDKITISGFLIFIWLIFATFQQLCYQQKQTIRILHVTKYIVVIQECLRQK